MFNNVVLNVAIGLVFIYLLYSLLATTIKEFIATLFSYRSRMLERGIEQMLDGKNYSYYWWDKLVNVLLWLWYKITRKTTTVVNKAAVATDSSSNSYFRKGVMDPVPTKTAVNAPYLKRAKLNKKAKLFAAHITEHALYRRSAENSILSKKPAYLSASMFADILIDVLKPAKGQAVTLNDLSQALDTLPAINDDLKDILRIYMEQANGDLQKFRLLVEQWYDETMDRVSGWYKKQANKVLFIIGLVLAFIFNISTISIVNTLSGDETIQKAIVQNASDYVKTHVIPDSTQKGPDSAAIANDSTFAIARGQLDSIKALYNGTIATNNNLLGLGWGDYGYAKDSAQWMQDSINKAAVKETLPAKKPQRPKFWGKIGYVLATSFGSWKILLGFLITALAISLGAPFWFDLLNKFVNLRVSGEKPADTKKNAAASKTPVLNQAPNLAAKG